MFFIKIYIKETYMNYYDTSIQMCGQYCILAPPPVVLNRSLLIVHLILVLCIKNKIILYLTISES